MKERIVTSLYIFAVILPIGYINNLTLTWAFMGIIYLVAIFESIKLYKLTPHLAYYYVASFLWILAYDSNKWLEVLLIMAIIFGSFVAMKPERKMDGALPFIYPTIAIIALFEIYKISGIYLILWLLIVVALTDSMAYFVGRSIGKTPFSPTSPKKTLEGVIGGILFGTIGGIISGYLLNLELPLIYLTSFVVSMFAVFGDLFESYLKRVAGVKDSGTFLPGHGGILDRIDGYLFSSIAVLVILRW